ncbi:hypothetical protein [Streptacidiphilus rugosus]|uniref:hypothetical protein n=1 Tax=Streptacidiphilus rugosus TaxID=405783 RepID=UPI00055B884D|nr:hypothetical protein [Streptacidiphilus rugosus]
MNDRPECQPRSTTEDTGTALVSCLAGDLDLDLDAKDVLAFDKPSLAFHRVLIDLSLDTFFYSTALNAPLGPRLRVVSNRCGRRSPLTSETLQRAAVRLSPRRSSWNGTPGDQ